MKPEVKRLRVNEYIRVPQVRVIDENGQQLGVKPTQEALKIAYEKGLDLIEIAPQVVPPVCKIADYSKYKYELEKRLKEERKKQKTFQIKEIRLTPRISDHDLEFKIKHAIEFFEKKCKVKFTIVFFGREMTHQETGMEVMNKIKEKIKDLAVPDFEPKQEGNRITVIFSPKK